MGGPIKEGKRRSTSNEEYEIDARRPDTRTKWQIFKDELYDPKEKTVLGRDKRRWGILGLFYLVFYSVLAVMCALCYMGLMATINKHKPRYVLERSIIGTNPGLGFRPQPNVEDGAIISYTSTNSTHIKKWTSRIDRFLEKYTNKSKLPNEGRNQMICDYAKPVEPGKVCVVDVTKNFGDCTKQKDYGYKNSAPCIFIKLNKIFEWQPMIYEKPTDIPAHIPGDLKNEILRSNPMLKMIWVSCDGETAADKNKIGRLNYYPSQGFPIYYYPYVNTPDYLSPIVAVQFLRPRVNETINVECKAWAKNIRYESRRGEKAGAVRFELRIQG